MSYIGQFGQQMARHLQRILTLLLEYKLLFPHSSTSIRLKFRTPQTICSSLASHGMVCGPSFRLYFFTASSNIVSKRFSSGIQWYRSPRGNGHGLGKVERWSSNPLVSISTPVDTKVRMNGACLNRTLVKSQREKKMMMAYQCGTVLDCRDFLYFRHFQNYSLSRESRMYARQVTLSRSFLRSFLLTIEMTVGRRRRNG